MTTDWVNRVISYVGDGGYCWLRSWQRSRGVRKLMIFDLRWETIAGLYAVHYLARRPKAVPVAEIARYGQLAAANLAKVMQRLRRAGIVRSERGLGFLLARPAVAISALDVVLALEGPPSMAGRCLMKNETCEFKLICPLSRLCREMISGIVAALKGISFADLPVGTTGFPVCMNGRHGPVQAVP